MSADAVDNPKIVSREEWLTARRELLAHEKRLTRELDSVRALRRAMPWVRIDKPYVFEGPAGNVGLADLFAGRSQLILRHFMFGPGWKEGCVGCSFASDHVDGALPHLEHHDVSYVAVSRTPLAEITAFKNRMGWRFPWVSSFGSDFNYDFHVSFTPEELARERVFYNFGENALPFRSEELSGLSVFTKNAAGEVFHTYSCYARGDEGGLTTYFYLDLAPKGRNEVGPNGNLSDWVRHHDRYEAPGFVTDEGRYVQLGGPGHKAE